MKDSMFEQLDFGAFKEYIDNDDITDISYTNNGQIWLRSLEKGSYRVDNPKINNSVVEKLAFQCSNVMGTTFNNASPFLDAESPELRLNFVHESIATNGIALVIRKTPAKIRLKEENLLKEDYITKDIHDFLIKCVHGHCNIMVCGETGSGKTEFVKYLASHTKENEKIITIEDTLELHLDKIYPHRDIVAMKTNNIASYSDVLVTCMRQNPKWILLSEVRSAEAVTAVRNSISSGHNILSTIHSDKASAIPHRLYSLMETDLDVDQFLSTIYRYIQIGVHIKAYYSRKYGKFHREIDEITEFYIDEETNKPVYNVIYQKNMIGKIEKKKPSQHLIDYLLGQNIDIESNIDDTDTSDSGISINDINKEEVDLNNNSNLEKVNTIDTTVNTSGSIDNTNINIGTDINTNNSNQEVKAVDINDSVDTINRPVDIFTNSNIPNFNGVESVSTINNVNNTLNTNMPINNLDNTVNVNPNFSSNQDVINNSNNINPNLVDIDNIFTNVNNQTNNVNTSQSNNDIFTIPRPDIPVGAESNELVFKPADVNIENTTNPNINTNSDFLLSSKLDNNQVGVTNDNTGAPKFFQFDTNINQTN